MGLVITGTPRSGTTMLVSALNSLDGFKVYGELFAKTEVAEHPQEEWNKIVQENIDNSYYKSIFMDPVEFVKFIFTKADGLKILSPHLLRHHPSLISYISENTNIIHIERRNKVKQAISSATNRKEDKISVEPKWLLSNIEDSVRDNKELDKIFKHSKRMKIYYEDITRNQNMKYIMIPNLSEFLGVSFPRKLKCSVSKMNPSSIKDCISNYDEVYSYFKEVRPDLLDQLEEK